MPPRQEIRCSQCIGSNAHRQKSGVAYTAQQLATVADSKLHQQKRGRRQQEKTIGKSRMMKAARATAFDIMRHPRLPADNPPFHRSI
jgi:hypothetical protein